MKKLAAMILAIAMMLTAFAAVAETKITVSGSGVVLVPADTAVVTLGVNAQDEDVMKAQATVNEKIEAIRNSLIEAGYSKEDINTDRLRIYAVYDYSSSVERIVAYNASSYLAIRTNDMDTIGQIIDLAFAAGANTLDGVSFSADDTTKARSEALTDAVLDARSKAEIIALAAGLEIKGIATITEGYSYSADSGVNAFYKNAVAEDASMAGGAPTLVQAAKVSVNATVNIDFIAE